jgi:hypothetical protein
MEALLTKDFKVFFGFDETDTVTATSEGLVKVNNGLFSPGYQNKEVYTIININGRTVNMSRIIYAAFHPESIDVFRIGCRINLVHPIRYREGTPLARNFLEDLILEPLSLRPEKPLAFDSQGLHPVGYGEIVYGVPYPLMYKAKTNCIVPVPNYVIELYDNYTTSCLIYHARKQLPLRTTTGSIGILLNGKNATLPVHNLILASAFPSINTSVRNTVDHINDDPTDHRITNLQWLTKSENSAKTAQPERGGRPIMMLKKGKDGELTEVCRFKSQYEAARLIRKYLPDAGTVKSIASKITRNNLHKPHYEPYNFKWQDVPTEIEGEVWKDLPTFFGVEISAYQVSNKGRVRNIFGYLFRPVPNRHGKYTSVSLLIRRNSQETKRFYIHFLVYCTFNDRLPVGDVLHNDGAPLMNGYYRNYAEDLSEGSRSLNMVEYNGAKRQRLLGGSNDCGPQDTDVHDVEDVMSEKASTLFNENTFHERGWVYTDLEDEARVKYDGDEESLERAIEVIRGSNILSVRRDYPFHLNFNVNSGGGCFYTSKAFTDDASELKGPKNEGFDANVKILHMIYAHRKMRGDASVDFAKLFEELAKEEQQVKALDDLFQICSPAKGRNIINKLLHDSGNLPQPGFFVQAARAKRFDVA